MDRSPVRPGRYVGLITVTGIDADDLDASADKAAEKGQEIGCDFIRYRGGRLEGLHQPAEHRFACGVWTTKKE
jgi:hypothetical protein